MSKRQYYKLVAAPRGSSVLYPNHYSTPILRWQANEFANVHWRPGDWVDVAYPTNYICDSGVLHAFTTIASAVHFIEERTRNGTALMPSVKLFRCEVQQKIKAKRAEGYRCIQASISMYINTPLGYKIGAHRMRLVGEPLRNKKVEAALDTHYKTMKGMVE